MKILLDFPMMYLYPCVHFSPRKVHDQIPLVLTEFELKMRAFFYEFTSRGKSACFSID